MADTGEADGAENPPLAQWCSLCGDGYHPNLEISIADEPDESPSGGEEFRWSHEQCIDDHGAMFLEKFPEEGGGDHA